MDSTIEPNKILKHPLFLVLIPAFYYIIAYVLEIGYFASKKADKSFLQIDLIIVIESLPYLFIYIILFIILYKSTQIIIGIKPNGYNYLSKPRKILIEISRTFIFLGCIYFIIKALSNDFNIELSSLILLTIYLILIITIIVSLLSITNKKVIKNGINSFNIYKSILNAINLIFIFGLLLLITFQCGKVFGNSVNYSDIEYDNDVYEVIRVYQDEILLRQRDEINQIEKYIFVPKIGQIFENI